MSASSSLDQTVSLTSVSPAQSALSYGLTRYVTGMVQKYLETSHSSKDSTDISHRSIQAEYQTCLLVIHDSVFYRLTRKHTINQTFTHLDNQL